jgi:hypothetical protein
MGSRTPAILAAPCGEGLACSRSAGKTLGGLPTCKGALVPFVYPSICSRDGKPFLSGNGVSSALKDIEASLGGAGAGVEPESGCLTTGEVWSCMCPNVEVIGVTGVSCPWVRVLCPFDRL